MTWEEHKKRELDLGCVGLKETEIECPVCGKNLYIRTDIVLTTYPETYVYECRTCDWHGYAGGI